MSKRIVLYSTNTWVSPLVMLRVRGPLQHAGIPLDQGVMDTQIRLEKINDADIIVIQRDFPRHMRAYRAITTRARNEGKPVIFELDDLLFGLPVDHPDRQAHFFADALLPMLEAVAGADLVTVSSTPLRDFLQDFNPNVKLLPNYLDDSIWRLRQPKRSSGPIVIGYMGGVSHSADLGMISRPLVRISERYGDRLVFRFYGSQPPAALADLSNVNWTPVKTMDYAVFASDFLTQEYDVALAPLRDNPFNRGKSAIKFLEYTALGVPGVYSAITPYSNIITHGNEGFLASTEEQWDEFLSRLIESPDLRLEIASAAQEAVQKNWLMSAHAQEWATAYEESAVHESQYQERRQVWPAASLLDLISQVNQAALSQSDLVDNLTQQLAEKEQQLTEVSQALTTSSQRLHEVENSTSWKVVRVLWRVRLALIPIGSRRERLARRLAAKMKPQPPSEASLPVKESSSPQKEAETDPVLAPGELVFINPSSRELSSIWKKQTNRCDIILLPVMDWSSRVQRPQQIAWQYAKAGSRVFYLHTVFRQDGQTAIRVVDHNIFEIQLPAPRQPQIYQEAMDQEIQQSLLQGITRIKHAFRISNAISMVDLPFWTPLAIALRREYAWKIVYDCMDYHRGFSTNAEGMLDEEDELVHESDMVVVASYPMLEALSSINPHCLRVPNGADFEHFRFPGSAKPIEMASISSPVIGYFGAIADWFDSDLVADLAEARSDWQFVLIGNTLYGEIERLQSLPNVHLLGEKPYRDLPGYLHAFDVAIIPLKKVPLTQYANQLKLFEYLSSGKPVVSTDLNDMRYYADQAILASNPSEWLQGIQTALQDTDPGKAQARREFARQNTWEQRFRQIEDGIQALYPKASLIILTYNNLDYTRLCIESILQKTSYPNYELVLVDNGSWDGTLDYLRTLANRHRQLQLVINSENTGFARGNNSGVAASSGEYLVFLNNDTVVTPGWLSGLLRYLRNPEIGLVGPVTNVSCNESAIPTDYPSLHQMDDFAARYTMRHAGESFDIRMLPFLCVAMRREVFDEVGTLDEAYGIGMFEDDDYAMRVKSKGYRILCVEDVYIHHWGSVSLSQLDPQEYRRLFDENRRKFETKWGILWEPHQYRREINAP